MDLTTEDTGNSRTIQVNRLQVTCELSQLLKSNFRFFLAEESRQDFSVFLSAIFSELKRKRCEVQIGRNNLRIYSVMEGTASEKEDKCLAMALDVTDMKRMESEQRNTY